MHVSLFHDSLLTNFSSETNSYSSALCQIGGVCSVTRYLLWSPVRQPIELEATCSRKPGMSPDPGLSDP